VLTDDPAAPLRDLELADGQTIGFARGVEVDVVEIVLPERVLGLAGDGLARQILPSTCSLVVDPLPELRPRFVPDSAARIWSTGESWRLQIGDEIRPLMGGDVFEVGGREFRAVMCPLRSAAATANNTLAEAPIRVVARYDTVHVHRGSECVVTITGKPARLLSELVAVAGPIGWEALAAELWPSDSDAVALRGRLDTILARLRRKLRSGGVRADLVHRDGCGHVELLLHPNDQVIDEM